jgi:hypothetical protein
LQGSEQSIKSVAARHEEEEEEEENNNKEHKRLFGKDIMAGWL